MPTLRSTVGGFVALAVVVGYLATTTGPGAADPATEGSPAVPDLGLYQPVPHEEGVHHFLVAAPRPVATATHSELRLPDGWQIVTDSRSARISSQNARTVDPDLAAGVRGTPDLVSDDNGNLWAEYPDGQRVLLSGDGTAPVPAAEVSGPLAALRAIPEVIAATRVDDETIAVATSLEADELARAAGLDAAAVTKDVPVWAAVSDPYFPSQWSLENDGSGSGHVEDADVDILDAWPRSSGGLGVVVAVLDTGVEVDHPDLADGLWVNPGEVCANGIDDDGNGYVDDCGGWDFVQQDPSPWEAGNHYHGTHVAGIIGARQNDVGIAGVAPSVQIMDLRVLDQQGRGYTSWFAQAIRYATDNGASVINMSLGTMPGVPRSQMGVVEQAVAYARDRGVMIVAAAGNSSVDIDDSPVWPASFARYYDHVVAVASTDPADGRSSFSNTGPATVTMAAPGSGIVSAVPGGRWSSASGTSMAAPMVAGAAALMVGDGPDEGSGSLRTRLVAGGDRLPSLAGLLVDPVRLNVGTLYEILGSPVSLSATGLDQVSEASGVAAELTIRVNDRAMFEARRFRWTATLLVAVDGAAHSVAGHEIAVAGATTLTDDTGTVAVTGEQTLGSASSLLSSGIRLPVESDLPAGMYALVVLAESVASDGTAGDVIAPAQVLVFEVLPGGVSPTTTGPDPAPTTVPTSGPITSTAPEPDGPDEPVGPGPGDPQDPGSAPSPGPVTSTTFPSGGGSPTTAPSGGGTPTTVQPGGPEPSDPEGPGVTTTTAGPAPDGGVTPTTERPIDSAPTTVPPAAPPTTQGPLPSPTTDGGGTSPTSTPSGGGPGPGPAPPEPAPTTVPPPAPGWEVWTVSPDSAEIGSSGIVSIYGVFPEQPRVWLGDGIAEIITFSSNKIVADLPLVRTPGIFDLTLRIDTTIVATVPGGFTFYDPDGPPPTAPTSTTWLPGVSTTSTTTIPAPTTTTEPDTSGWYPAPLPMEFGEVIDLPGGLRGARLTASGPLRGLDVASWPEYLCRTSPCSAVMP